MILVQDLLHTDGEPAAKRPQFKPASSAQKTSGFEGSESSQGEDEEFICQYCGKDLDGQGALNLHEQRCSQRSSSLKAQQELKQWERLFAQQQQQLQQQRLQQQQLFAQQQQQRLQQQQWQLQQQRLQQ